MIGFTDARMDHWYAELHTALTAARIRARLRTSDA